MHRLTRTIFASNLSLLAAFSLQRAHAADLVTPALIERVGSRVRPAAQAVYDSEGNLFVAVTAVGRTTLGGVTHRADSGDLLLVKYDASRAPVFSRLYTEEDDPNLPRPVNGRQELASLGIDPTTGLVRLGFKTQVDFPLILAAGNCFVPEDQFAESLHDPSTGQPIGAVKAPFFPNGSDWVSVAQTLGPTYSLHARVFGDIFVGDEFFPASSSQDLLVAAWDTSAFVGDPAPCITLGSETAPLLSARRFGDPEAVEEPVVGQAEGAFLDSYLQYEAEVLLGDKLLAFADPACTQSSATVRFRVPTLDPDATSEPWCSQSQSVKSDPTQTIETPEHTYLAGGSGGTLVFGAQGAKQIVLDDLGGGLNGFLAKIDNETGDAIWALGFGGGPSNQNQRVRSLARDAAGNLFIYGEFTRQIDLGEGPLRANGASTDLFLAKFSPDGELLASQTYGGPFPENAGTVTVSPVTGDITLTGKTTSRNSNTFGGSELRGLQFGDTVVRTGRFVLVFEGDPPPQASAP